MKSPSFVLAVLTLASSPWPQQDAPLRELRRHVPDGRVERAAFGDIDGDGDVDALVLLEDGSLSGSTNAFLENDGQGVFRTHRDVISFQTCLFGGVCPSGSQTLGDLDGDGAVDLLWGQAIFQGSGDGRFVETASVLPGSVDLRLSSLADLDGDGDLDVLAARPDAGLTELYRNDGGLTFTTVWTTPVASAGGPLLADLDRDGDEDLVLVIRSTGQLQVLRNDGFATFSPGPSMPASSPVQDQPLAVDVDLDGWLDLVIRTSTGIQALRNLGNRFGPAVPLGIPPAVDLAAADWDGDGDTDLVTVRPAGLWANVGGGVFQDETQGLPTGALGNARQLALQDLDGDLDIDVLAWTLDFRLLLGDGSGRFLDPTPAFSFPSGVPLDADGDGDVDVFNLTDLYRNDGRGGFDREPTTLPGTGLRKPTVGDLDGDGDLDVLSAGILLINDGNGTFTNETSVRGPGLPSSATFDSALADIDDDGDLDVVVANLGANEIWLNDGSGFFTGTNGLGTSSSYSIVVFDADGDGHADVAVGNLGTNELFLGNGLGSFTEATPRLQDVSAWTQTIDAGDFDGDGDLDLYFGDQNGGPPTGPVFDWFAVAGENRLLLNDGAGNFTLSPLPHLTLDRTSQVELTDIDADGDLDVVTSEVIGRRSPSRVSLYLNDGNGGLTSALLPPLMDWTFVLGDFDGDRDLDLSAGGKDLFNTTRHLARRGLPRAGRRLDFELFGPATEPYVFAASLDVVNRTMEPFGVLRLRQSELFLLRRGLLGADGTALESIQIPADPALVGFTVFWQALVGGQPRFTNLEPTTVTVF